MATPPTPPTVAPVPPSPETAEDIVSRAIAYQTLMNSYREFSEVLRNEGAEAATKYANAMAQAQGKATSLSYAVGGVSESLKIAAEKASSAYQTIKADLLKQAEQVVYLNTQIKTYDDTLKELEKTGGDAFRSMYTEIKRARIDLNELLEQLDRTGRRKEKIGLLEQVEKLRKDLKDISSSDMLSDTGPAASVREKFIEERILKGANRTVALRQFNNIVTAIKKEAELLETTPKKAEEQAYLKTILDRTRAQEKRDIAVEKGEESASSVPEAKKKDTTSDALQKTNSSLTTLIDRLTGATEQSNVFASALISLAGEKGIGGLISALSDGLAKSFLTPEKAASRLVTFLDTFLIKSTFKFDETLANVNKTTGGFREEFEKIALKKEGPFSGQALNDLYKYGINLERMANSYSTLSREIGGFNNLSDEERRKLTENAAMLENLNGSISDYAKSSKYFMGTIGQTADGAAISINKLTDSAIAAGKNVGDYIREFNQLSSKLTGFGRDAESIFRGLSAASQATKGVVSASDFAGLTEHFKDYETAARSALKLAAVFNGFTVDPKSMVGKDPLEILRAMKTAFEKGRKGQPFSKLELGFKREIATFFGGNLEAAQAAFNMKLSEATREMGSQNAAEKERLKRMEQSAAAMRKFETALENLKISFTPLLEGFTKLAKTITDIGQSMGPSGIVAVGVGSLVTMIGISFTALEIQLTGMFTRLFTNLRIQAASLVDPTSTAATSIIGGSLLSKEALKSVGKSILTGASIAWLTNTVIKMATKDDQVPQQPPIMPPPIGGGQQPNQPTPLNPLQNFNLPPSARDIPPIANSGNDIFFPAGSTPILPGASGKLSREDTTRLSGRALGDENQFLVRGQKVFNLNPRDNLLAFKTDSIFSSEKENTYDKVLRELAIQTFNLNTKLIENKSSPSQVLMYSDKNKFTQTLEKQERSLQSFADRISLTTKEKEIVYERDKSPSREESINIEAFMNRLSTEITTALKKVGEMKSVAVFSDSSERSAYEKFRRAILADLSTNSTNTYL